MKTTTQPIFSYFILFCFFLYSFFSISNAQTIEISGTIYDSINKEKLPYGNVFLKNDKDSIITGVLTNDKGEFKLKKIAYQNGQYLLVNYLGYFSKRIEINYNNSNKINIDKIFLRADISQMKEVTVVGKTKYMEQQFDRKVFNISTSKTSSAKNIFDLLRTLPGVTVEQNDKVKYKGAPASIYVDDQPAEYVYPKTEMIPVANVLKIELIDASLRNGASKGGIINIKMKNIATNGISGMAQTNNNTIKFKDINNSNNFLNLNYKAKKVLFFYNLNYDHTNSYNNTSTDGTLNFNTNTYTLNNTTSNKNVIDELWNYGGIRILINPKTKFRLSGGFYKDNGTYFSENYYQENNNDPNFIYDKYNRIATSDFSSLNKWINTSFYHSFDSLGKEISIYGGSSVTNIPNSMSLDNYNYQYISNIPVDSTYHAKQNFDFKQGGIYGGLYYNHPINTKTRWNCGWNGWFQYKGDENNIYSKNEIVYLPLTRKTKSTNQDQTAYWRIGTTVKKWKFDVGISAQYNKNVIDYTRYNINSEDTLLKVNKDYLYWLPSATIVFSIDSIQEIKLSYSKSIQSVWDSQLCDFINKQNPRYWSSGNSDLKPTAYHNLYLGYTYTKQNWNFNTDAFYSITNDDISYLTIPYNDVISITKPANIAHNSKIGIDVSFWISIKEKYDINLSSSVNHTSIKTTDINANGFKKKEFGYNVKLSTDVLFSKKITGTFYINYFSREITFEGYKFDYINSSISVTRKFLDNKLFLTMGVNNLFDNIINHGSYYNFGGISQTTIENYSRYKPAYFISLQYKFRQGDRGTKDSGKMRG